MYTEFEIREMPLAVGSIRNKVSDFLSCNGLRLEDVDAYFCLFALESEEIIAGGGYKGNLIKCVAVAPESRDEGVSNRLISHLVSTIVSNGHKSVKVFTKPENSTIFESFGFNIIASSSKAILMDNSPTAIAQYTRYLSTLKKEGTNGAIVMNANPFTLGHRYLAEQAAKEVDNLYIIAVKENRSEFSYLDRFEMLVYGCSDIPNVCVCEGSEYIISSSTFPTYFLKEISDSTDAQIELDLDIFIRHIAPALNISVRFVGSEPADSLTNRYNEKMKTLLPLSSIRVQEIERLKLGGEYITATSLRTYLQKGLFSEATRLSYKSTIPYLISYMAKRAMQIELDTSPKPGLVDTKDSGAHSDMDYDLMKRSIEALSPFITQIAVMSYGKELPQKESITQTGSQAYEAMLRSTNNVNTHKGALLSLGLAVATTSNLYYNNGCISDCNSLRREIAQTASLIEQGHNTHGETVRKRYKISGAIENAREGYPQLFESWLPFYKEHIYDEFGIHKTLLLIMSQLDDTNIYFRDGAERALEVKRKAKELLGDFSISGLEEMNREFIAENISPGGCADMLALTIFTYSILNQTTQTL